MRLQQIIQQQTVLPVSDWDRELTTEVQQTLANLGRLTQKDVDGIPGPKTKKAFADFKLAHNQADPELLGAGSAQLLLDVQKQAEPSSKKLTLAQRVVKVCNERGYTLNQSEWAVNIIGIEGLNLDGTPNSDAPDQWNDVVGLLTFKQGKPSFLCLYKCTTEPGSTYTNRPLNPNGAARLQLGQHKGLWAVGLHRGYEAMQQVGRATVVRDRNKNHSRDDVVTVEAGLGINLHTTKTSGWKGTDGPTVGPWSAGCTVIKDDADFLSFMKLIKQSAQYKANRRATFDFTLLWKEWL